MPVRGSDICLILVAIVFPPAAAFFITGCSCDLLINICLTLLGYLPGHLHAFWLIYRKMKAEEQYGCGGYHYIGSGQYEPIQGALGGYGAPPPAGTYTAPPYGAQPVPDYGATR